jgi:hypothetical protein
MDIRGLVITQLLTGIVGKIDPEQLLAVLGGIAVVEIVAA